MSQHLTKEMRQDIINEDFRFLDDIKIHNTNGKLMMGDGTMPFNISAVLYEKEFVEKWLMSFALNNPTYFKAEDWFKISNNGTRAVMVVDDDHKPLLVVPPMIATSLTPREMELLQQASRFIHSNSVDTMKSNDPNANLGIAKVIARELSSAKRVTLQAMVIPEFYEKHGIVPLVEQQLYYIKDKLLQGKEPIENINRARFILYANHRKEQVSQEEVDLIERMMRNSPMNFEFNKESLQNVKVNGGTTAQMEEQAVSEDPLEC